MKYTNIEEILVFLVYNLKGRKKKRDDWITIAKKCKEAADYFKSYKEVAERTRTSPELIRSILKLLELPDEVKQLLKERRIGMDIAQRIMRIENPRDQISVAKEVIDLSSHDARSLIEFAKKNPNATPKQYKEHKERLLNSKRKIKNLHITLISLEDEIYKKLKDVANEQKISTESLIKKIIENSLKK